MSEGRWELVDRNPHTGVEKWMDYDQETDSVLIATKQDKAIVQGALDRNKWMQSEHHDRREDMWHAAHVPATVAMEWLVKYGVDASNPHHWDGVKRLLNSNEYAHCRVRKFQL